MIQMIYVSTYLYNGWGKCLYANEAVGPLEHSWSQLGWDTVGGRQPSVGQICNTTWFIDTNYKCPWDTVGPRMAGRMAELTDRMDTTINT